MKKRNKLTVAYFAGSLQPGHDGVTRVLYKLIEYLDNNDVEGIFFSPIIPEEDQPVEMQKVPSVTFPLYKEYKFAVPGRKYFEERLNEFQPDLIHINSPCSLGYAAVKYGNKNSIPVAATYHTHFASYAKYYKVKAIENFSWNYFRKLYNSCQKIYVPSLPILEELKLHGIKNLEYLPHGVDTEIFNPSFASYEWKKRNNIENKYALLFAGRLVWEKDLETLAKAYKILSAIRNDIKFVIAGDGPVKTELQKLMPDALFTGYRSGKELSEIYASSDLFVFPSTTETFGNVTIEAMASGLPPICAREGGAYGVIKDGENGLITNPRDPEDLAEKINFLLDNPQVRLKIKENAVSFAKGQTWDRIIKKMVFSYMDVILKYQEDKFKEFAL